MVKVAKDQIPTKICWMCDGEGKLYDETTMRERETGAPIEIVTECPECDGTGVVAVEPDGDAAMEEQWEREHFDYD